ncbi:MAG: branched-chain amino acid aminotransferase, partial [Planctomycetaceae bacterium]
VSLGHARRLALRLGIPWREASLTPADLAAADEILLTSTPSCVLAATRFDGRPVGPGAPGPVCRAILAAWSGDVGLDLAAQARAWAAGGSGPDLP